VRRLAAAVLGALALSAAAAGCGVKGPPKPAGAPERPAPRDTMQAAPPAPPEPATGEGAK